MKIKKYISKVLVSVLLINSFSILSNSDSLDTRYESLEGNYLNIDDVLESSNVNLEVEGNTLVNYMDYSTMTTNSGTIINRDTKEITFGNSISENSSPYTDMDLYSRPNLKPGETYTIIVNVLENTISGSQFFALLDSWQDYMPNEGARISHGKTGIVKAKFTVKESNNGLFKMYLRNYKDQDNRGILKIKDLMILEGDWTDKEPPTYFEGMKSVGEKGDINEIELISNNQNLFDMDNTTNKYISHGGTTLSNADHENKTSDFIKIEPNSFYLYNVENFTNTNGLWTGYAFYREKDMNSVINDRVVITSLNDVIIETPEDANYIRIGSRYLQQEGVKVYFQKVNSNYSNNNKNLFDINSATNQFISPGGTTLSNADHENKTSDFIKIEPNTLYLYNVENFTNTNGLWTGYGFYKEKDMNSVINDRIVTYSLTNVLIKTPEDANYLRIGSRYLQQEGIKVELRKLAELSSFKYEEFTQDIKSVALNESLRSLPNGVKDRIIKRNGQWVVERNTKEIILDGSENWQKSSTAIGVDTSLFSIRLDDALEYSNVITDRFLRDVNQWSSDTESVKIYDNLSLCIRIQKDKLQEDTSSGFKEWLKTNNIRAIYQLKTPVYEPLKVDLSLQLFEGTTYISNDSIIPTNMKIIIDRIANMSDKAIKEAIANPTSHNIQIARRLINQMPESQLKDSMQARLSEILGIEDMQLERKTASANLDIYIKSENMLSLSLDTNNVTFDDFSGVEDVEKLNAINLTVNSSLPYKVNAYLASEIQNADKSNTMDKDILNIRVNGESNYNTLIDAVTPVTLLDDQNKGNNITHSVDLKLKGNIAHQKDVYKATIKFEVEQK